MTLNDLTMMTQKTAAAVAAWSNDDWLRFAEVAAVLLAAAVAWRQLALLRRQLRDDHIKACRDRALEYSLMRCPQLREMREAVDTAFPPDTWRKVGVPWHDLQLAMQRDPHLRICLITLFAHWENLALTIAAGVCDERIAFDMVADTLLDYVERFKQFLLQRRSEHQRLYAYLLRLADRWRPQVRQRQTKLYFRFRRGC